MNWPTDANGWPIATPTKLNPLTGTRGEGSCGSCSHIVRLSFYSGKSVLKCTKHKATNGTDCGGTTGLRTVKAKWPGCAQFTDRGQAAMRVDKR